VLDLTILVAFVAIGGKAHDLDANTSWFLVVLWPLVVSWLAAALAFRVYSSVATSWRRMLLAWGIGMAIALLLRAVVTGRPTPLPFVIVLLVFTAATMLGWRVCERFIDVVQIGFSMKRSRTPMRDSNSRPSV
jgi:hypothetical protein